MAFTKLYFEALRKLPDKFVDDNTKTTTWHDSIIATNPKYKAMIYRQEAKKWLPLGNYIRI